MHDRGTRHFGLKHGTIFGYGPIEQAKTYVRWSLRRRHRLAVERRVARHREGGLPHVGVGPHEVGEAALQIQQRFVVAEVSARPWLQADAGEVAQGANRAVVCTRHHGVGSHVGGALPNQVVKKTDVEKHFAYCFNLPGLEAQLGGKLKGQVEALRPLFHRVEMEHGNG